VDARVAGRASRAGRLRALTAGITRASALADAWNAGVAAPARLIDTAVTIIIISTDRV
jgi:hypothetical protein